MDSLISEEMIYSNLVSSIFSFYEKCAKDQIYKFFKNYDPRKSINRDYIVKFFNVLYGHMAEFLEEI